MKKTVMIMAAIMAVFILMTAISATKTKANQTEQPSFNEQKEIFITVIVPFVLQNWKKIRVRENGGYVIQIINQIIMEEAKKKNEKDLYNITIVFYAENYQGTEKTDEAVLYQSVYFIMRERIILEYKPMKPTEQQPRDKAATAKELNL